jgi:hypothetical protein
MKNFIKYCIYIFIIVFLSGCSKHDNEAKNEKAPENANSELTDLQEKPKHPISIYNMVDENTFTFGYKNDNKIDFHDITYGNGIFVAVGKKETASTLSYAIVYSTDGLTWNVVDEKFGGRDFISIAYGNNLFLVITGGRDSKIAYSNNGIDWILKDNQLGGFDWAWGRKHIVFGNNIFVAINDGIVYSANGETWDHVEKKDIFDKYTSVDCLFYGNKRFYAGTDDGRLAYSYDGKTWNIVNYDFGSLPIRSIAYGNNRLLVFSYLSHREFFLGMGHSDVFGCKISYSDDGKTWHSTEWQFSERSAEYHSIEKNYNLWGWIRDITYSNGYFVAVGAGENVAYSKDGVTWEYADDDHSYDHNNEYDSYNTSYSNYTASVYEKGVHVIIGNKGQIRVSKW